MTHRSQVHRLPLLVLLLLSLLFFYPILFGQVLFFGDTLTQRIPSMVFWKQSVLALQPPLWNPYIFAGIPHLADLSTNTLSPFNLAYLLINNPFTALSWLAIFEIFTAAACTYFFLILLKLNRSSSLFGAIVFSFSGTVLAAANDINSLQGIVLIPLIFLMAQRLIHRPSLRNIALLSLSLTLQFISGHPQYSYYTWVLLAAYLLAFLPLKLHPKLASIFLTFLLFLGLGSVQLLPFLELSRLTYRPQTLSFASQNSLQLLDLPRFVLADIYGTWRSGTSWGPASPLETGRATTEGFVGLFTLLLSLVALAKARSGPVLFFGLTALFSFILAFGPANPAFTLARNLLPLFNNFRSPMRLLAIYTFALAPLAAHGFNSLTKK